MHPSPADEGMPAADSNHPETVSQDGRATDGPAARVLAAEVEPDRPQAGVPVGTVTDETPALGTSETMKPVQGVHRPEVGT